MHMKIHSAVFLIALLFGVSGCAKRKQEKKGVPLTAPVRSTCIYDQPHQKSSLIIPATPKLVRKTALEPDADYSSVVVNKKRKKNGKHASSHSHSAQYQSEIEARLGDVPLPVMVTLKGAQDNAMGGYALTYETSMTPSELLTFYRQEMMKAGWLLAACFESHELLLSFKKQRQTCTIFVRPVARSWWGPQLYSLGMYLQA